MSAIDNQLLTNRLSAGIKSSLTYFIQPISALRGYPRADLRPDLVAGLTVSVLLLPQAIVFALMAGLPAQFGLYSAVVAAIVGALWGSSNQLHSGPTNTASLLVLATLLPIAAVGSPEYLIAASVLAIMVGIFRLLLGIARLGMLVNFVSDSVIIGFTAGAGVVIWINELSHFLRITVPTSSSALNSLRYLVLHLPGYHWQSLVLGLCVAGLILAVRSINYKLPGPLIALILAATVAWLFNLQGYGIKILGVVEVGLPHITNISLINLDMISQLSTGVLAIGAIGLVEALSIARSISSHTGQRLDSNQEFIGQGLANIACGLFSGYACSASFSRSAVNYNAGARTGLASVFSGLFVLVAALALSPFITYIPRAALAGVLFVIAYGMIDRKEITRILHGAPGDVFIMATTFGATLLLPLQFAVLTGILSSFAVYILRTSLPRVVSVLPDDNFKHLIHRPDKPDCPQMAIFKILGDLYFGAVSNIEKVIHEHLILNPDQRFLILSMESVNHCDISGVHTLESILRTCRDRGGDLFFQRVQEPVMQIMQATGFADQLGKDNFLSEDHAISKIFHHILDPAICIYECEERVFLECQNLPKQIIAAEQIPLHTEIPTGKVNEILPNQLWEDLHGDKPPLIVDVREPREYQRGHIPQAKLIPLNQLLTQEIDLPREQSIVTVCRSGRRGSRAAFALSTKGYTTHVLKGGMLGWENAGLLEAIE